MMGRNFHTSVKQFRIPLWLVLLAVIPLGMVFFVSLLMAAGIAVLGAGVLMFVAPLFRGARRPASPLGSESSSGEVSQRGDIVLDPADYERIESRSEPDR
jgi:hypothetical protein